MTGWGRGNDGLGWGRCDSFRTNGLARPGLGIGFPCAPFTKVGTYWWQCQDMPRLYVRPSISPFESLRTGLGRTGGGRFAVCLWGYCGQGFWIPARGPE